MYLPLIIIIIINYSIIIIITFLFDFIWGLKSKTQLSYSVFIKILYLNSFGF